LIVDFRGNFFSHKRYLVEATSINRDEQVDMSDCQDCKKVDLVSFYFLSHFYFLLDLFSIFSIFKTWGLGLEVISHTVTSVTSDSVITTLIMGLKRKK